jgi:peptide/nickel transport system permease protein
MTISGSLWDFFKSGLSWAGLFFSHWITHNILLVLGFAFLGWVLWRGSHHERWRRAWLRFRGDRVGCTALAIVGLYLVLGAIEVFRLPDGKGGTNSLLDVLVSGVSAERSYSAPLAAQHLDPNLGPLQGTHLLGTDALGKDVLVQTLKACQTALIIGGLTSAIYIPLGTLFGMCAGYFRRRVDDVIQYIYTTLASIPEILLLVAIILVLGKNLGTMSFALGITAWVGLCRLIRGETMRQSERSYIAAARALGQSHVHIVLHHLLPNVLHLVVINFVLGFSGIVLAEAVLSYLGVGTPVGTASWGNMIDGGRAELGRDPVVWWNLVAASGALFGLVLSLNLLGDALRRAFDPKRS